jgi:hypothetical protein
MHTFTPNTVIESSKVNANFQGLADGSEINAGAIGAEELSTSAVLLGSAAKTSNQSTGGTGTNIAVTGLTAAVTIPSGGRGVEIECHIGNVSVGGTAIITVALWDGPVGSGTQLASAVHKHVDATYTHSYYMKAFVTPAAGAKTYNVGISASGSGGQINASATNPSYILVKAV